MSCDRIAGSTWTRAKLIFDDVTAAEVDDTIDLDAPDGNGNFTGRFRHRDTGQVLQDQLMNGRCIPDGLRSRVVFVRKHNGVSVVTRYIGKVIPQGGGSTTVLIRGKFTRATTDQGGAVTIASGDYETEKPT